MAAKQPGKRGVRISHPNPTGMTTEPATNSNETAGPRPPFDAAETDCLNPSTGSVPIAPTAGTPTPRNPNAGNAVALPTVWAIAVKSLVRAMFDLVTRAGNPNAPITPDLWTAPLGELAKKREACRTAAEAVGDEDERLRVSRTLRRIHADAESCAERLRPPPADAIEAQRWNTEAMLPISRLFNALRNPAIAQEFEEATVQRAPAQTASPQVEQSPPMTTKQRQVWEALNGEVLTADKLAEILDCDRSTLITYHLVPLKTAGRIKSDRKVGGYYRPDKPPTTD